MLKSAPDRDEKGYFLKGNQINVSAKIKQNYQQRTEILQAKYTVEEILSLAADKKKLFKLSVQDAQIIKRLAVTLADIAPASRTEVRLELEAHLDRTEGKPKSGLDDVADGLNGLVSAIVNADKSYRERTGETIDVTPVVTQPDSPSGYQAASSAGLPAAKPLSIEDIL